jgi:sporulation protein YlmC with PRC-barrel domain
MMRLTDLLGATVTSTSGGRLGHVIDVRVSRHGDRYRVDGLVTGSVGVRARLGLRRHGRAEPLQPHGDIPWNRVTACESGRVVVDEAAPAG